MLNKNYDATRAAKFKDKRSRVLLDGREILKGKDMGKRREEVWERDKGKCCACRLPVSLSEMHLHHIVKRSRLRDDRLQNLQTLHWSCHMRKHNQCSRKHIEPMPSNAADYSDRMTEW